MIQDATDQQIKAIQAHFPLSGKQVLDIGCGKGRVTRDLAKFAERVITSDPDKTALESARQKVTATNVDFCYTADGIPHLAEQSLDLAIYSLSLHHIPEAEMQTSLLKVGKLLKKNGIILVLEPAEDGTFNEAKRCYGAGSGDEGPLKAAALLAMKNLPGWKLVNASNFFIEFWFEDERDFITNKLPRFAQLPDEQQQEIRAFLRHHRQEGKIILTSERCLYRLQPL